MNCLVFSPRSWIHFRTRSALTPYFWKASLFICVLPWNRNGCKPEFPWLKRRNYCDTGHKKVQKMKKKLQLMATKSALGCNHFAVEEKQHPFQSLISLNALTLPFPYDIFPICSISAFMNLVWLSPLVALDVCTPILKSENMNQWSEHVSDFPGVFLLFLSPCCCVFLCIVIFYAHHC